ncbi:hypothetical protein [Arthrobacter sp. TMS2-4]
MKKSFSWRLFVLVAGALLGLLAGMGLAAPAVASPVQVAASGNYHDNDEKLILKAKGEGKYVTLKVVGKNYDGKWIDVEVYQVKRHHNLRTIDDRDVRAKGGYFEYKVNHVKCGETYVARSDSDKKREGRDWSNPVHIKCDRKGHYHG